MCVASNAQITQNNMFAIYLQHLKKEIDFLHADKFANLQYLKKEIRDEVNFLHVDKH